MGIGIAHGISGASRKTLALHVVRSDCRLRCEVAVADDPVAHGQRRRSRRFLICSEVETDYATTLPGGMGSDLSVRRYAQPSLVRL